jgi:excisionase family DNA binding protein
MPRDSDDALLSVAQAATLLGVHPNTIRSWTDAGRLTAYRINTRGDRRYRRRDVARLLVDEGAARHGRSPDDPGYAVFARLAEGLAAAPTIASVARALVEALRDEFRLSRAAVYVTDERELALAAHAGPGRRPVARRALVTTRTIEDGDLLVPLATPRTTIGALLLDREEASAIPAAMLPALGCTAAVVISAA